MRIKVIYEDQDLLLVDKPAGLIVNRSQTVKEPTLQDYLAKKYNFPVFKFKSYRNGIVHRLDKETSGILIVAKTSEAFKNIQDQFKKRTIRKHYLALVHGCVFPQKGIIKASVRRNPFDREKFGVFLGGKKAETAYKISRHFINTKLGDFNLLELMPKTGRTHQIRVHLKYFGYPVVSDDKYGGRKAARSDRKWCSRHFLHASSITFNHPTTKKEVTFSSPLPRVLQKALETLQVQA